MQAPTYLLKKPLEHLVNYLIDGTSTEMETVRAVYRWITAQNLSNINGNVDNTRRSTAMEYLIGITNNSIAYSTLMADMCRSENIN